MQVVAMAADMKLSFECDRFVVGLDSKMAMVSFVANASVAKSVIALIQSGKRFACFDSQENSNYASHVYLSTEAKYRVAKERLPSFNAYHVVAMLDVPGIVIGDAVQGIADMLFSEHITTPMLQEWIPFVSKRLVERNLVRQLRAYGTDAYALTFRSEDVDTIVADGLKRGKLLIPRKRKNESANPISSGLHAAVQRCAHIAG
jgi:hypothetical protein